MPQREDEYWANQKEKQLRYCYKHKRYYKAEIGCQLCYLENSRPKDTDGIPQGKIELVKCPNCLKVSLHWNPRENIYECMNLKCKWTFTRQRYEEVIKEREAEPKGKAWFGNEYFDPKKKKWRKP